MFRVLEETENFKIWKEGKNTFGAWFKTDTGFCFGYGETKQEAIDKAKFRRDLKNKYK